LSFGAEDGYLALETRAQSHLAMARAYGSLRSLLARLCRIDVLGSTAGPSHRYVSRALRLLGGLRGRLPGRSTILTSQLPVSRWHEQIGDPTLADGILERLVHNAHRIEMRGDSRRKNRGKPNA
jgi:IstB-like ATP binding protein